MMAAAATQVAAQGGFGVGIILGEPTGLSLKSWLSNSIAIDAAAAWSFSKHSAIQLHADYLIHNYSIIGSKQWPLYYGIGGRLKLRGNDEGKDKDNDNNDLRLGVRVPFGITFLPSSAPFDFFVEVVPVLDLVPGTDFDLNGAIGGRFYFR
jgi:hypothetical protein